MKSLIYYTVGHNRTYIKVLRLSVESLRVSGYSGDIAVLCDESFLDECRETLGSDVLYKALPDSKTPEQASMNKLRIFELPDIHSYDCVLFLDSDILVYMSMPPFLEKITNPDCLYVYTESRKPEDHRNIYWSLGNYTDSDIADFREREVYVFNAGCFAFVPDAAMEEHFLNIQYMIMNHSGPFFYEQSFMNVYFNRNGKTDRTLITPENYAFPPKADQDYFGYLLHFAGCPGDGREKSDRMRAYIDSYLRS